MQAVTDGPCPVSPGSGRLAVFVQHVEAATKKLPRNEYFKTGWVQVGPIKDTDAPLMGADQMSGVPRFGALVQFMVGKYGES